MYEHGASAVNSDLAVQRTAQKQGAKLQRVVLSDSVSTPASDPSAQMIVLDGQLYDAKSLELSKTQGEGATLSDSELEACALLLNKKKV